jgi:hypothetical protein
MTAGATMERKPLTLEEIPQGLRRNVEAASPPPMRMMAARGLVPAPPNELVVLLYQLTFDAEPPIAKAARDTLAGMPQAVLLGLVSGPLPTLVLDLIAELFKHNDGLLEKLLFNPKTGDETFATVAEVCSESITELIASNEVRLLRHPPIIEGIFLNPAARMSTVDRVTDLGRRHKLKFERVYVLEQLVSDVRTAQELDPKLAEPADDAAFKKLLDRSLAEEAAENAMLANLSEEEVVEVRTRQNEAVDEGKGSNNRQAEIGKMSISQKVRTATLGSKSDRDYLVRDNNRLVHMAAVTSPKVQPSDIMAWSGNKALPENIIMYIGTNGKYRRNYKILVNIVNNPKAPLRLTSGLINTLSKADLAKVQKNRNLAPTIQRLAKSLGEQRAKGRG